VGLPFELETIRLAALPGALDTIFEILSDSSPAARCDRAVRIRR